MHDPFRRRYYDNWFLKWKWIIRNLDPEFLTNVTFHLCLLKSSESSHKQDQNRGCKMPFERLLTVSKLPLCMSSIGGRKRSARVLSFLSTVPLRSSCSCRTTRRTFTNVKGRKVTVEKEAKTDFLGDVLVSVWKSLKPSKMDRAGLLRFGTAEAKKGSIYQMKKKQKKQNSEFTTGQLRSDKVQYLQTMVLVPLICLASEELVLVLHWNVNRKKEFRAT